MPPSHTRGLRPHPATAAAPDNGPAHRTDPDTEPPSAASEPANHDGPSLDEGSGSADVPGPVDRLVPLYTPAGAAELLAVKESWLRRRAAARRIPCTLLGKHLRFSPADIHAIAAAAAHTPTTSPRCRATATRGRAGPPRPRRGLRPTRPPR